MPFNPTAGAKLVATGDKAVDDYLRIARSTMVPQRTLEDADDSLVRAQEQDTKHSGFRGTAEHRQRCERRYDEAKRALDHALRVENTACDAARGGDPAQFARAANEIATMWRNYYDRAASRDRF